MSSTTLKWIAIITMIIDHIGAVFFPQTIAFRIIGRLAFPIFAFLIAEGCLKTRNIKKYALRLGLFALISDVPFDLAFFHSPFTLEHQNVFFTLFLGVVGIYFYEKINRVRLNLGVISIMISGLLAEFLNTDYGIFGVLMIFCIYMGKDLKSKAMWVVIINIILGVLLMQSGGTMLQSLAAVSAIPILFYNGEKGKGPKYLFYIIYPAHLLVIAVINYTVFLN